YLAGRLDEFRIYSRALTATEVSSLVLTSPAGLLASPAALTATPGVTQTTLSWSTVVSATSYDVLRATSINGPFIAVNTGLTTTTCVDTGLTTGVAYYYVVVARSSSGESPNSPVATATAQ